MQLPHPPSPQPPQSRIDTTGPRESACGLLERTYMVQRPRVASRRGRSVRYVGNVDVDVDGAVSRRPSPSPRVGLAVGSPVRSVIRHVVRTLSDSLCLSIILVVFDKLYVFSFLCVGVISSPVIVGRASRLTANTWTVRTRAPSLIFCVFF